jgi:hypothetical protein
MSLSIIGRRSELGRLIARRRAAGKVLVNVAGRHANTLVQILR